MLRQVTTARLPCSVNGAQEVAPAVDALGQVVAAAVAHLVQRVQQQQQPALPRQIVERREIGGSLRHCAASQAAGSACVSG